MPYWIGPFLSKLLDSAGVKATFVLIAIGGCFYGVVLLARYVAGLFERILANRDRERTEFAAQQNRVVGILLERVAEADKRRTELENETTKSLVNIVQIQERTASELGRFRDETGSKLNAIKNDIEWIKGRSQ